MTKAENNKFINPTRGEVSISKMMKEIVDFVEEEPDSFYRLIIGTDSQARRSNGKPEVDYVTAVVVHRIGKGARYYWRKEKKDKIPVLRDKIYTETTMSLNTAEEIVPMLRENISAPQYDFEIHIDVGSLGPTRSMIKEVVGMVPGSGYQARTKPESWGASSVADKHA